MVSVPFHHVPGSPEEKLKRLNKSKSVLKAVQDILEDDEEMEKLMEIGSEEKDDYIKLQLIIGEVERLLTSEESKNKKDIALTEQLQDNLCKHLLLEKTSSIIQKTKLEDILRKLHEMLSFSENAIKRIESKQLQALLDKAGISGEDEKSAIEVYEDALTVSNNGYKIVHKRDVDEIFVNNYNTEWIMNWNGNMDLQLCLDYYAVITYISDYYSKDDSGTMGHIRDVLKKAKNENLKTKLSLVVNTFLTHRQIGECEAYFKILPQLEMKSSNIETVFMPTGFKMNRSSF